jgi:hypothetical protein
MLMQTTTQGNEEFSGLTCETDLQNDQTGVPKRSMECAQLK